MHVYACCMTQKNNNNNGFDKSYKRLTQTQTANLCDSDCLIIVIGKAIIKSACDIRIHSIYV